MSRRFTGVTDINGRKIYTGDTVKMHYFYEAHDYHTLGACGQFVSKLTKQDVEAVQDLMVFKERYKDDKRRNTEKA